MKSTVLNTFAKKFVRSVVWAAKKTTISQILAPRCRRDGLPEHGRFTSREIRRIVHQTKLNIQALMPSFIDHDNIGNYQNEYVGLVDLAIYRALVKNNVARDYAVNLVGDMMWQSIVNAKGSIPIIDPLRKKWWRMTTRDPMIILGKRLKAATKYPYSEPGYRMKLYLDNNVYCMDIYSCPVFDFYKQFGQEEMTLFRRTWCTHDYAAAEYAVEGGKYRRQHTLSDGDGVCDMRWFVET